MGWEDNEQWMIKLMLPTLKKWYKENNKYIMYESQKNFYVSYKSC